MRKQNCWEFKNCGRQPGGAKVKELGVCPASTEKRVNGVHGGKNGGRSCWAVLATNCSGSDEAETRYSQKLKECMNCDFYKAAVKEEYVQGTYKTPIQISALLV